ncbi:MAG: hypothetical protein M3Z84_10720, partial [Actinomycetota bacterium]|nr:hypothetical protein [Actinomycetota bacterium]
MPNGSVRWAQVPAGASYQVAPPSLVEPEDPPDDGALAATISGFLAAGTGASVVVVGWGLTVVVGASVVVVVVARRAAVVVGASVVGATVVGMGAGAGTAMGTRQLSAAMRMTRA